MVGRLGTGKEMSVSMIVEGTSWYHFMQVLMQYISPILAGIPHNWPLRQSFSGIMWRLSICGMLSPWRQFSKLFSHLIRPRKHAKRALSHDKFQFRISCPFTVSVIRLCWWLYSPLWLKFIWILIIFQDGCIIQIVWNPGCVPPNSQVWMSRTIIKETPFCWIL